ncbi:MAG TPA: TRAM domain-containing protein [Gemmatimonadales bacterium]|nr:TRAM domain-containing protein [Gemmatimonadales bacterium]
MSTEVVAVSGIAAGGDGVGRLGDGRAVFVPRTAPGERVALRTESLRMHRTFARGDATEIVEPAAVRVAPPCPHYGVDRCGGCQLQHLSYEAQLQAKRTIVGDALRRIGKLDVPDPAITAAGEQWRYRTSVTLAVRRGRGGAGGAELIAGFHPYDRPDRVFPLVDCRIADARLMSLWRELQPHLDLLPERATRMTLRLDREGTRHLVVESSGEPWRTADRLRAALAEGEKGEAVVCWWQPMDGAPRVVAGPATGFPPTAFDEVKSEMSRAARRWAVEGLGDVRGMQAWDLYGGAGDTAQLLAARGARVVSVDADEKTVAWARGRSDLAALGDQVRCIAGRVEDLLPGLPAPQVVVMAPPRAGLHWDVALRLTGDPVPRLAYLSRDPATLARDLQRLNVNYRLRAVEAFDLFPQTAQVETVAHLEAAQ